MDHDPQATNDFLRNQEDLPAVMGTVGRQVV